MSGTVTSGSVEHIAASLAFAGGYIPAPLRGEEVVATNAIGRSRRAPDLIAVTSLQHAQAQRQLEVLVFLDDVAFLDVAAVLLDEVVDDFTHEVFGR